MFRQRIVGAFALCSGMAVGSVTFAQEDAPAKTLFTNVHIFDGVSDARIENANVLVEGNIIKTVSRAAIDAGDALVIRQRTYPSCSTTRTTSHL